MATDNGDRQWRPTMATDKAADNTADNDNTADKMTRENLNRFLNEKRNRFCGQKKNMVWCW